MATGEILSKHILRDRFAVAMSGMYCEEIPAYAALVEMVAKQNIKARSQHSHQNMFPEVEAGRAYHGAIRLGSIEDLRMMRRAFAIMGMQPVGYYDLSAAGLPVHSTAFRPISSEAMEISPFRVFTSLLRLDMIEGEDLKQRIKHLLSMREVFTPQVVELIEIAETQGGLSDIQADKFVVELLETFRWKKDATVSLEEYKFFNQSNRLLADIVSFHGPHINHLTVGAEDIDEAHKAIATWQGLERLRRAERLSRQRAAPYMTDCSQRHRRARIRRRRLCSGPLKTFLMIGMSFVRGGWSIFNIVSRNELWSVLILTVPPAASTSSLKQD